MNITFESSMGACVIVVHFTFCLQVQYLFDIAGQFLVANKNCLIPKLGMSCNFVNQVMFRRNICFWQDTEICFCVFNSTHFLL